MTVQRREDGDDQTPLDRSTIARLRAKWRAGKNGPPRPAQPREQAVKRPPETRGR